MTDSMTAVNTFGVVPEMTLSSSPVLYPTSSSPAPPQQLRPKRKLFQQFSLQPPTFKKPRLAEPTRETVELTPGSFGDEAPPILDNNPSKTATNLKHDTPPSLVNAEICGSSNLKLGQGLTRKTLDLRTSTGRIIHLSRRKKQVIQSYEQLIADRSVTKEGRAKRAYYGVEIHQLIDDAKIEYELREAAKQAAAAKAHGDDIQQSIEVDRPSASHNPDSEKSQQTQLWTEKYRAKKFTDLVGDERTHRTVLRWLKAWDSIVFPGNAKQKTKKIYNDPQNSQEYEHRKVLLLTGPPGLGKTTLAHVCAKQAGYEVLEINASDDRSRDVVKDRIKDALATETVRGIQEPGKARRTGRPVCVVVDEVDGVTGGSGSNGGEGGFMKALIDLVQLDQRNTNTDNVAANSKGKRKGDRFKMLRPLILVCNDVYAPSLRPLRTSSIAEIIHVRKPPIDKVISRLKLVFEKESIQCENDAVRRLCEDCWGLGNRRQNASTSRGTGDGDIRGVLVHGEWLASKLRHTNRGDALKLTRKWVDFHTGQRASTDHKGLGRGGVREIVDRLYLDGAGLPQKQNSLSADEERQMKEAKDHSLGLADLRKRAAITAIREMIDTCGDHDRLTTDCFQSYAAQVYQDDTFLTKPNTAYDWLHFHDSMSGRVFSGQEWELSPYLSTSACAFHTLFSSVESGRPALHDLDKQEEEDLHPFSGMRADFAAHEAQKQNKTLISEIQSQFSAEMLRLFSSVDNIAAELVPNVCRMVAPDVKPVVVGGSAGGFSVASVRKENERNCVSRSVAVMSALNLSFEKVKIENEAGGYGGAKSSGGSAFRMEP